MHGKLIHIIALEKTLNQRVKKLSCIYKNLITFILILLGILIYIFAEYFLKHTYNLLSQFYFYYFTLQAIMIVNRGMNYLIVQSDKYFPFPVKKREILFLNVISIIRDRNIILSIIVIPLVVTISLESDIWVKLTLIIFSLFCTLLYYLSAITIITFLPRNVKENSKIYIGHLLILVYVEVITRISQANFLWDIYPFSGWVGSAVMAAYHENYFIVFVYLIGIIGLIVLTSFIAIRFMYPRGKYVY
jgi:hypothetical protein